MRFASHSSFHDTDDTLAFFAQDFFSFILLEGIEREVKRTAHLRYLLKVIYYEKYYVVEYMIKAKHVFWAEKSFYPYVMWLFKRSFHTIQILGEIPDTVSEIPLLLLPNHSTWWDGFFVYLLNKKVFHRVFYLMMLEEQLTKYRFFSKIGAYSVEPKLPKSLLETLNYSVSLLKNKSTLQPVLCIFPQGELKPWNLRPLDYKRGIEWLLKKYGETVNILPLAIRVEFLDEQHPEVFFLFGQNYQFNYNNFPGISWLEKIEISLLDDLSVCITREEEGSILLRGYRSVNESFDALRQKIRDIR